VKSRVEGLAAKQENVEKKRRRVFGPGQKGDAGIGAPGDIALVQKVGAHMDKEKNRKRGIV